MSKIENGGPAFPSAATRGVMGSDGVIYPNPFDFAGMSLRDWFAGQVLAFTASEMTGLYQTEAEYAQQVAVTSYKLADAMIAARKTGGEQ
jgi:hypothetical protein